METKIKNAVCDVIPEYKVRLDFFEGKEQIYGDDAIHFTKSQIQEALKELDATSIATPKAYLTAMRKYIQMYKHYHGYIKTDYDSFSTEDYEACINKEKAQQLIFYREDILKFLSMLTEEYQYLLLGMFEGIGAKRIMDVVELEIDNVYEDHVILPGGEYLPISEELYKVIKNCFRKFGGDGKVLKFERRHDMEIDKSALYYYYRRLKSLTMCESLNIPRIRLAGLAYHMMKISEGKPIKSAAELQKLPNIDTYFDIYGYEQNTIRVMYRSLQPYL